MPYNAFWSYLAPLWNPPVQALLCFLFSPIMPSLWCLWIVTHGPSIRVWLTYKGHYLIKISLHLSAQSNGCYSQLRWNFLPTSPLHAEIWSLLSLHRTYVYYCNYYEIICISVFLCLKDIVPLDSSTTLG